jgi:hypothetical protein
LITVREEPPSSKALTANVLPSALSATEYPNCTFGAVLGAFTYACCVHVAPLRTKMYAAPADCMELSF